jgi:integrase
LATTNPAGDVAYFRNQTDGSHSWTDDKVARFEAKHPIGSKGRLALALMLYIGQRRSVIVLFGREHVSNGWIIFTQQKNRNRKPVRLKLPIHAELKKILDASPCVNLAFLVTEFNRPFTANGFGSWLRKRFDEAGLFHCSAHGLRKASATRLANRGATEHEIMSITCHTTCKEVTRYTKTANHKKLATMRPMGEEKKKRISKAKK